MRRTVAEEGNIKRKGIFVVVLRGKGLYASEAEGAAVALRTLSGHVKSLGSGSQWVLKKVISRVFAQLTNAHSVHVTPQSLPS